MHQEPLSVLKKRQKLWLKQFNPIPVILNQYQTYFNENHKFFRIFQIKTNPQVQTDAYDVFRAALKDMPQSIKKKLGAQYFGRRGYTIYHLAKQQMSKEQIDDLKAKPPTYHIILDAGLEYDISLKFVKQSKVTDKENSQLVTQFLNIRLKNLVLKDCRMKQLVPNVYFPKWDPYFTQDKFQVQARIGFKFNLQFLQIQLFCDINNRLRQMNKKTFLDVLYQKRQKISSYIGKRVAKNYGDQKAYLIVAIREDMSPMSKFQHKQKKMTYVEYFKTNYQKQITQMKQPMVQVQSKKDLKVKKNNQKIEQWTSTIFLVPELVSLTDIADQVKRKLQKQLAISPNQCIQTADYFIKEVNSKQKQFKIVAQNRRGYAHQLPQPLIQVNQTTKLIPKDGAFRIQSQILQPIGLVDVLVVYSVGKNVKYDQNMIEQAIKILNKAGQRFKIQIKQHFGLQVSQNAKPQQWMSQVQKDMKQNGKPSFALFALMDNQKQFYPILKEYLTYKFEIDSQMFLRSKINNQQKGVLAIAGNVMKQIAAKKNHTLWKIQQIPKFQDKLPLIIGISIQRMGSKFQLVISRNINKDISKFITKTFQLDSKQIPDQIMQKQFYSSLEDYIKNEKKKCKPSTVIIYRMGLNNENFVNQHIEKQYNMLKARIQYISLKKLNNSYNPQLVYIQVLDSPSQKIWVQEGGNQPNSILPKVGNPPVGTVMRGQDDNQFYLIPYKARIGTVRPSFYKVHKNDSKVPLQYLTQFTYAQTYMYYNWQGSIRLPQVLQFCKKVHQYVKPKQYKNATFNSTGFI